jgi:hypothetical protein
MTETTKRRATSAAPHKDPTTGRWEFWVDVPPGADGKRRLVHRRGFSTKKAAQEELDRIRGQARTNSYAAPKRQTLGSYLVDDWLLAKRVQLAASTWESYRRNIRLHVVPRIGGS